MGKTEVTPNEAKSLLEANQGYIYLDVRTAEEFEAGRPPGAMNIPLAEIDPSTGRMELNPGFQNDVGAKIPRNAKLIVGCKSGGRSARACEMLRQEGYTHVLNMVGGFGGVAGPGGKIVEPGWSTLGYPVEHGPSKKVPPASVPG